MENQLILSPSPHIFTKQTTPRMMKDVITGLLPVTLASIYFFRIRALILITTCVISCVVFEYVFLKIMKRKITIGDYSAVVTGMLLAFVLPPAVPFWVCIIGALVAIVLVKQIFGGLGSNIFNPTLLGRAFFNGRFSYVSYNVVKACDFRCRNRRDASKSF